MEHSRAFLWLRGLGPAQPLTSTRQAPWAPSLGLHPVAPHSAGLSQASSPDHTPEYPRPTSYFHWVVSNSVKLTWADSTSPPTLHQNHSLLKSVDGGSNYPGTQAQFCKHSALLSSHPHVSVTRTSLSLTAPCSLPSSETPASPTLPAPTLTHQQSFSNHFQLPSRHTPVQSMVEPNILKTAFKALHRMDPRQSTYILDYLQYKCLE